MSNTNKKMFNFGSFHIPHIFYRPKYQTPSTTQYVFIVEISETSSGVIYFAPDSPRGSLVIQVVRFPCRGPPRTQLHTFNITTIFTIIITIMIPISRSNILISLCCEANIIIAITIQIIIIILIIFNILLIIIVIMIIILTVLWSPYGPDFGRASDTSTSSWCWWGWWCGRWRWWWWMVIIMIMMIGQHHPGDSDDYWR